MKEKKIFKVTINSKEYLCYSLSAVRDLLTEKDIPIKPYQLWKMPKDIGITTTIYNVTISAAIILLHENPNKGKYKRIIKAI